MPAIHGGVSDEMLEAIDEHMVGHDGIEERKNAVEYALEYTLYNKYGIEL